MTTRALHERLALVEVPIRYSERLGDSKLSVLHDGRRFLTTILWTALGYNPARVLGLLGLLCLAVAAVLGLGLVGMRAAGVQSLGVAGVFAAFSTLFLGVAGVSILNLGITFNYLVALFHRRPVRQGLFGRPVWPGLDRHFGLLGLAAMAAGALLAVGGLALGLGGWDITRTWLWLLGSALAGLVGLQLGISWVLMRVLEDLSVREEQVASDLAGPAGDLSAAGAAVAAGDPGVGVGTGDGVAFGLERPE
jgi:hypothetical protein